ncbi:hypothetical protein [Sediminibacter sp. Hel_I_10]|uniref:hypothetical protein n=1 Tax=Sediminibacter sp. Hel_I_10 TaxID=1392490 RepID=UPI00047CD9C4|nr:hypothetical protein [Sediminibacter sp. Hel_I_10]
MKDTLNQVIIKASEFEKSKLNRPVNQDPETSLSRNKEFYFLINQDFESRLEHQPDPRYLGNLNNSYNLLSKIYVYNQNQNAIEALTKEKAVITGAEQIF